MKRAIEPSKKEIRKLPIPLGMIREFNYTPLKWADLRQEKVETLRERFRAEPSSVFVLGDNKLENDHLVVYKKSHFEEMLKVCEDLASGEAAVKHSVESVIRSVSILLTVIEENKLESGNKLLSEVVQNVSVEIQDIQGVLRTDIVLANAPFNRKAPALSAEEKAKFLELTANEEG